MSLTSGAIRQLGVLVQEAKERLKDTDLVDIPVLLDDYMGKAFTIGRNSIEVEKFMAGKRQPACDGEIQVVQPNTESLSIVRLFLEKHETLSADERKEILTCIRFLNSPVLKFSPTLDSLDTK